MKEEAREASSGLSLREIVLEMRGDLKVLLVDFANGRVENQRRDDLQAAMVEKLESLEAGKADREELAAVEARVTAIEDHHTKVGRGTWALILATISGLVGTVAQWLTHRH